MGGLLRVVDFGSQPPLRSQTLWHAIAFGVSHGCPPTLSFVYPSRAYVSVGRLHPLSEVDLDSCRRLGLPVYRRMVGGGTVYLDANQLFFQITVPAEWVPAWPAQVIRRLLEPAVLAFRDVGVPAEFDEAGEIVWDEAKISGTAGAHIEEAAVAVGNVIRSFDYDAMTQLLNSPNERFRQEFSRLLRKYLRPTPVDWAAFKRAAVRRYSETLGLVAVTSGLSAYEVAKVAELDQLFEDPDWIAGVGQREGACCVVKVRSGVWVFEFTVDGVHVVGSVVEGRLEEVQLEGPALDGRKREVEAVLAGMEVKGLRGDGPGALRELGDLVREAVTGAKKGGEYGGRGGGRLPGTPGAALRS